MDIPTYASASSRRRLIVLQKRKQSISIGSLRIYPHSKDRPPSNGCGSGCGYGPCTSSYCLPARLAMPDSDSRSLY